MNELLLMGQAVACTLLVLGAWRYARERLYSLIVLFLILITAVGGKIIEVFGYTTNTGNIFYAAIYLATYFLIERLGRSEGIRAVWLGVIGVACFFVFVQSVIALQSVTATSTISDTIRMAYEPFSRLTIASVVAYVLSQNLNVYLYIYLKERFKGARLWLRANICNLSAQALDSVVFFTIAFWAVIPPAHLRELILTGLVIKVVYVAITSPLLYFNRIELDERSDGAIVSMR